MKEDPNVMCFTVGNGAISNLFKTNINRPPKGVNPKEWINTLCDLLTESFNVSFGVHKILLETLDETFQGWGVYENSNLYPNWEHIKRMLEVKARDSKGRETGWYESALRIATVLTFGEFGKVVNYDGKKSLSFEDLFDKKVIFELNSLSNIEKKFFCEFILTYIYKLKKAGNEKASQEFNHAILVDEAHNIFLKKETKFMSESVTDMIYREMREYGTSLICLDQHASKLSDTVIGNSACHVAFQQQLPQDLEEISSLMQLRDKKEIFTQLPVGSAIVKLSERHTSPFLIEVPFTDLRDLSVEDSKVKTKMNCVIEGYEIEKNDPEFKEKIIYKENLTAKKPLVTSSIKPKKEEILVEELNQTQKVLLEFVKSKLSEDKKLNEIEKLLDSGIDSGYYSKKDVLVVINIALSGKLNFNKSKPSVRKAESVEIKKTLSENLTKEELSFVNFLMGNSNHCMSTVELYKSMGLSSRKGNVIKEKLFQKGILKIEEERNEKGWRKLIKLSNSYSL
ncbi:MAG TPA: ATP-binding protein [Nanoarchaeota archaeon]|nr:ATP-binding protein [Nanoarchaeota archaeon]